MYNKMKLNENGTSISHCKVVVIISANAEWRVLRNREPGLVTNKSPFGEWFLHTYPDIPDWVNPVLLFHGGWGKIASAASTQYVIDQWRPLLIINLGTCGGFDGEIDKGTIILVERTIVYDIFEQMGDKEEHIKHYTTEIDNSWVTEPYPLPVRRSLLISGDRDLIAEDIPKLKTSYAATAGDWESGSIAWVANRNRTQCLILRGVTDLVGDMGGEAYDGKIQVFIDNTNLIMNSLIDSLSLWINKFSKFYTQTGLK